MSFNIVVYNNWQDDMAFLTCKTVKLIWRVHTCSRRYNLSYVFNRKYYINFHINKNTKIWSSLLKHYFKSTQTFMILSRMYILTRKESLWIAYCFCGKVLLIKAKEIFPTRLNNLFNKLSFKDCILIWKRKKLCSILCFMHE